MNMTRMREVDWLSNITSLYKIHKRVVILGDQDLINIYFSVFPGKLAYKEEEVLRAAVG